MVSKPERHLWFWSDPDFPENRFWPDWLNVAYGLALRTRCLWLFHEYEKCDYGDGMPISHTWYCVRCLGPYMYDEDYVTAGIWGRFLFRLGGLSLLWWWNSWAWRFER